MSQTVGNGSSCPALTVQRSGKLCNSDNILLILEISHLRQWRYFVPVCPSDYVKLTPLCLVMNGSALNFS